MTAETQLILHIVVLDIEIMGLKIKDALIQLKWCFHTSPVKKEKERERCMPSGTRMTLAENVQSPMFFCKIHVSSRSCLKAYIFDRGLNLLAACLIFYATMSSIYAYSCFIPLHIFLPYKICILNLCYESDDKVESLFYKL